MGGWGVGGRMWVGGWEWEGLGVFLARNYRGTAVLFGNKRRIYFRRPPAKPDPKPIRAEPVDLEPVGG